MKSYQSFVVLTLLVAVALSSCSGLPKSSGGGTCITSCAGGGNSLINMIVTATPSTKFSVLRFAAHVTGLSVTNAAGKNIGEIGDPNTLDSEGYRLQTESQFISKANITGDNYKSVTVTIGDGQGPFATGAFVNTSTGTVLGCLFSAGSCAAGSVNCTANSMCILPQVITQAVVTVPFPFTVIAGQNIGIDVNLNLDIAMTTQKVDFTLPGAVTVSLLPRPGQTAGSLDSLEDYTGQVVSTASGNIITATAKPVQEQRDFTVSSGTLFNDNFQTCASPSFACAAFSQTVSVDALIKSDGFTFPGNEVDFLDKASTHQAEGIVTDTTNIASGQFKMLLTNFLGGNLDINNPIGAGDIVTISLNTNPTFGIDTKNLLISTGNTGFASESDLFVGQVVMARALTQTGVFPNVTLTSDRVLLRYSHISGTVGTISGNNFTLTLASLPGFLGLTGTDPTVQTSANVTTFDGIASIANLNSGDKVSIRTLYLNPTKVTPFFIAAKVRKNL